MKRCIIVVLLLLSLAVRAVALGPHEVLVLVNETSTNSVDLAGEYARIRSIPEGNIVRLAGVPLSLEITPEEFTRFIWEPAIKAMAERKIDDHILAWVYSVDFPTTIKFSPPMSIQGLTFLRNKLPGTEAVYKGVYVSPLFSGPDRPDGKAMASQTFDVSRAWLGDDMPLPSMMLGYTGERGNSRDEVVQCLQRGVASDRTAPQGLVCFVTNGDVRTTCRMWQFRRALKELQGRNVKAVISTELPVAGQDVMGVMCGSAGVNPAEGGGRYLPGSVADNLTSFGAVFSSPDQTKLTAWIKAGATAAAGTVTEPYSAWTKFTSAWFYVHYASGCTVMESYYQSIRCPLQILLVGDALAQPWAPKAEVVLAGLASDVVSGVLKVSLDVQESQKSHYKAFVFLLDGKVVGRDRVFTLDPSTLKAGEHRLRGVAYRTGCLKSQVFAEKTIVIK